MLVSLLKGDAITPNVEYTDLLNVNYYAKIKDAAGENGQIQNLWGLSLLYKAYGVDRGAAYIHNNNKGVELTGHYRVSGTKLIKVNKASHEVLGTISGSGQARIFTSQNNIVIIADSKLYYYNKKDGLRLISGKGADGTGSSIGAVLDGCFSKLIVLTDGKYIYSSDALDETKFMALDFASAEERPDGIVALGSGIQNYDLAVFGRETTQYFNFNGAPTGFPFKNLSRSSQDVGLIATHGKVKMSRGWIVLSQKLNDTPDIIEITLGGARPIASAEVKRLLKSYNESQLSKTVIETLTYDDQQLVFVRLLDVTLVYNETVSQIMTKDVAWSIAKTGREHESNYQWIGTYKSINLLTGGTYRAINFVFDPVINEWVCGDSKNNNLGYADKTISTQYDEVSEGMIYTPLMKLDNTRINKLSMDLISGYQEDDETSFNLSYTNDGVTYNSGQWEEYGQKLNYNRKYERHGIGYCKYRIGFMIRTTSNSRMSFANFEILGTNRGGAI